MSSDSQERLAELRARLLDHPLYASVDSLPKLRVFMESHAFAVWDFMSLLKRLQADICPSRVPWLPPADVESARFVNEIVLAEESDTDVDGSAAGHLDIYLAAMDEVGADASGFRAFLAGLVMGRSVSEALNGIRARRLVREFVGTTVDIAQRGSTAEVAAAFLYGREDPIPRMFQSLLGKLDDEGLAAPRFAYYLERHIELDGDSHGPMGERLLARLIDGDLEREQAAAESAARAIEGRLRLWDELEREVRCIEGDEYRRLMGV